MGPILACETCRTVYKAMFDVIVSLAMFTAIMAFHLISFVVLLLLSIGIMFAISLIYYYLMRNPLTSRVENILILEILSVLSKFHVICYYKLIYPGDNNGRICWGFVKVVRISIYVTLASISIFEVVQLFLETCKNDDEEHGLYFVPYARITPSYVFLGILNNPNQFFLVSIAVLVHLFSVSLYKDYSELCVYVPLLSCKSLLAISFSTILQICTFSLYLLQFYTAHAWIPRSWKENTVLYVGMTQLSLIVWLLLATILELLIERKCNLSQKDQAPFYWLQNTNRGRVLFVKLVLIPLVVHAFFTDCQDTWFENTLLGRWEGYLVPAGNFGSGLPFLTVLFAAVLHASKTLMLLQNGVARLIYGAWMCYFRMEHSFVRCCQDDGEWSTTDSSSGTTHTSQVTEIEPRKRLSGTHGCGGHNNRKWRFWPQARRTRQYLSDGNNQNETESAEEIMVKGPTCVPVVLKNGVGDIGFGPLAAAAAEDNNYSSSVEQKLDAKSGEKFTELGPSGGCEEV